MQSAWGKVENPLDSGRDHLIDHGLRVRRRHSDDGDIKPFTTRDALQFLDVEDGHPAPRFVPNLLVGRIEERRNLEPLLTKPRVVGQRQTEVAGADNGDAQPAVEPQDLTKVAAQLLHVVADTADAEFTKICEVLSNLRGIEMELLGQSLRG